MNLLTRVLRLNSIPFNLFAPKNRRSRLGGIGVLERLEDRQLLTTFTVTSTDDTTDPGTLRWAIEQANSSVGSDSIEFDASFNSSKTIVLNGTALPTIVDTTGRTTITGPGAELMTISGNQLSRVFAIGAGATATLSNVHIADGNAGTGNGGAIQSLGDLKIQNVHFTGNTAANGGAIYVGETASLRVETSAFTENSANNGGAIANVSTTSLVTIAESDFTGNSAVDHGGGIKNDSGFLRVTRTTFSGNTAEMGGAITNYGTGVLTVLDTDFEENSANFGGAIWAASPDFPASTVTQISDSSFTENDAGMGAGIQNQGSLLLENSTFTSNTAIGGAGVSNDGSVSMRGTNFQGNVSELTGGGIYNSQFGALSILGGTLSENVAMNGGGIQNAGRLVLNGVTFTSNSTTGTNGNGVGGAVYTTEASTLTAFGANFLNNVAAEGGAVGIHHQAQADLYTCLFQGNTATTGGAIMGREAANLFLYNSTFAGNSADLGGALWTAGDTRMVNSTFANNLADQGGAIYLRDNLSATARLAVLNTTIADNSASIAGGGLYLEDTTYSAQLVNTIVGRNLRGSEPDNISGTLDIVYSVHNLIGPGGSGGLNSGLHGNIVLSSNDALGLGTLAFNGGLLQNMALLPDSPAIDAGTETAPFPIEYPFSHTGVAIDIGAVESAYSNLLVSIPENTTFVVKVPQNPINLPPGTFSLTGGEDQALFAVDSTTGDLTFIAAPDFENPGDTDHDNVYLVQVTVSIPGRASNVQNVVVTVQNGGPVFSLSPAPAEYVAGGESIPVDSDAAFFTPLGETETQQSKLVVTVPTNADVKDKIEIISKGKNEGPIRIKKNNVLFNGVVVGTIEKRTKVATDLTIRFNAQTTDAAIQAIVRQITFSTKNKNGGQPVRTVRMQIFQSDSTVSAESTRQVSVVVEL